MMVVFKQWIVLLGGICLIVLICHKKEKVYAGINSEFQEVIWLYPTEGNSEPDSYIIYNYEERTWVFGKLFEDGIVSVFQDRNVYDNTITIGQVSATDNFFVYNNEPADIFTGNGQPYLLL